MTTATAPCECGCGRPARNRGLSHACYEYRRRHGVLELLPRPTDEERFFRFVAGEDPLGYWEWTGAKQHGYGAFRGAAGAHRWSYEYFVGEIPTGLHLDHLCRNRACVNPWHLDPVTNRENTRRGVLARRQEPCRNGHPPSDRYMVSGELRCRVCRSENRTRRAVHQLPDLTEETRESRRRAGEGDDE